MSLRNIKREVSEHIKRVVSYVSILVLRDMSLCSVERDVSVQC